jgi:hypothetical protein
MADEKKKRTVAAPSDEELYRQQNYDSTLERNQPKKKTNITRNTLFRDKDGRELPPLEFFPNPVDKARKSGEWNQDFYLNPNQPKNNPIMRAATNTERFGDKIRNVFESVSEQPLARLADALGLSDFEGNKKTFTTPDSGERMGMMPGGPGKNFWGRRDSMFSKGVFDGAKARKVLAEDRANPSRLNTFQGPPESSKAIGQSHPALPAEFNMQVANPSRTAPIDADNLPSGKIEYLDPDVAEYMNPIRPDPTTSEGQRRLRFLTGK